MSDIAGKNGLESVTLPDQLKGKTPEEVYSELQKEFDAIIGMREAEKAKLMAEKTTLENVIQNAQRATPQQQAPQQQEPDLWSGPDDIVSKVRAEMAAPLAMMASNMRNTNRESFVIQLQQAGKQDDWAKYGGEIEQVVNSFHPDAQGRPEAYKAAYSYVRGMHVDEITSEKVASTTEETVKAVLSKLGLGDQVNEVIRENKAPQSLFQRQVGVPVLGTSKTVDLSKLGNNAPGLTAEQAKVARRFGMDAAEYLKYAEAE